MRHSTVRIAGTILLVFSLLAFFGCAEKTPEEELMQARAKYSATLVAWSVIQPPADESMEVDEAAGEEAMPDAAMEEPAADVGEEEEEMAAEEVMSDEPELANILLDILIRNENLDKLPGITVDVSQANENGDEIRHWRIWVDTSGIERGPGTQVDHRLDDVEIVEGYGFHVEVRSPIAEADRGEYRELSDLP